MLGRHEADLPGCAGGGPAGVGREHRAGQLARLRPGRGGGDAEHDLRRLCDGGAVRSGPARGSPGDAATPPARVLPSDAQHGVTTSSSSSTSCSLRHHPGDRVDGRRPRLAGSPARPGAAGVLGGPGAATPGWATRCTPTRASSGRARGRDVGAVPVARLRRRRGGDEGGGSVRRWCWRSRSRWSGGVHLGVYPLVAAVGDAGPRRQLLRTAVPVAVAAAPGGGAGWAGRADRALGVALVVDYTRRLPVGHRLAAAPPRHFAERHGLIVIIALGESIIAVGVGVADLPITLPIAGRPCWVWRSAWRCGGCTSTWWRRWPSGS